MRPDSNSRFCEAVYLVLGKWWETYNTPYNALMSLDPEKQNEVLMLANWPDRLWLTRDVGKNEPFWQYLTEIK